MVCFIYTIITDIKSNPFHVDDLSICGASNTNITLTQWISLWSLLMFYETEMALTYLLNMGAQTIFLSCNFIPKWSDFINPHIATHLNTFQRFYNVLIVRYANNKSLINQFIRSSVNDFDNKYNNDNALNTILLLKPKDKKTNSNYSSQKYSYAMLNDTQKCHHNFLYKNTKQKRKPLIQINVLNQKNHGIDIYHTFESTDIDFETEKNLKKIDSVIFIHTQNAMKKCKKKIVHLYNICRDIQMPIITVTSTNNNQKLHKLLQIYNLPKKIIKWESFEEDQIRFNYDLIQLLHFRQLYIPKTIWQIRKINVIYYTKKTTIYTFAIRLICYLTPFNMNIANYLDTFNHRNKMKIKYNRDHTKKRNKKDKNKNKNETETLQYTQNNSERWKALITLALVTSVFYGSYYIYDIYGKYNKHKQQNDDNDEEDEHDAQLLTPINEYDAIYTAENV